MAKRGLPRPILLGGGAAEYHSGSALMTGDIDLASPAQAELEEECSAWASFVLRGPAPSCAGGFIQNWLLASKWLRKRQWWDGRPRAATPGGAARESARFRISTVEDLIADRMGQYASGTAPEMLEQAKILRTWIEPISSAASRRRRSMSTGSKNSKADPEVGEPVVDMAEFGRELLRRRADYEARYGVACELPRNSGARRTESKRALLRAIEEADGKW